MKDTLRETAPGSRSVDASSSGVSGLAPAIEGTSNTQVYDKSSQYTTTTSGISPATATSTTPSTHDNTSKLPSGHGTGHADTTQSVVDRLNANVQASVRESTGKTDPHVAEEQPKTSTGKRILEGLGLGGDERKETLRGTEQ